MICLSGGQGWQADLWIIAERGDGFQRHVARTLHRPFIILLEQHGADEADEGRSLGKIPTTSARRFTSLFRRSSGLVSGMPVPASVVLAVRRARSLRATGTGELGARKVGRPLSLNEL